MPFAGPSLSDRGLRGAVWHAHWQDDYAVHVVTHASYTGPDAAVARRVHAAWRQVIETVNEHLEHRFGLPFPDAKTVWGLRTRIAAKLVAFNLGLALNRLFDRPPFAFATLFS